MGFDFNYIFIQNNKTMYLHQNLYDFISTFITYEQFFENLSRLKSHPLKQNLWGHPDGEVFVDADLNILLFYLEYNALGHNEDNADLIYVIAQWVKQLRKNWSNWHVHWAYGGKAQIRDYIEQRKNNNLMLLRELYFHAHQMDTSYLINLPNMSKRMVLRDNNEPKSLDSLYVKITKVIEKHQKEKPHLWKDMVWGDLDRGFLNDGGTSLLFHAQNTFQHFHFEIRPKQLLAHLDLINFCHRAGSYMILDWFPEEKRWKLVDSFQQDTMVVDVDTKRIVVVPAPGETFTLANALTDLHWDNWELIIDISLLLEYVDRATNSIGI